MASIITGIFKKTKSGKQLVEALAELLDSLPSKEKLLEVTQRKAQEFGNLQKVPSDRSINQAVQAETSLGVADGLSQQEVNALDGFPRRLAEIKIMLCGSAEAPPKNEDSVPLARELVIADIPMRLIAKLGIANFEARKDIVAITNYLLAFNKLQSITPGQGESGEDTGISRDVFDVASLLSTYFGNNANGFVQTLLQGYNLAQPADLALHCGSMLRQSLLHKVLYDECLNMNVLGLFFTNYLHSESFDICSDAFATFRDILTKQKHFVSPFLDTNYETFFPCYNKLLESTMQYVTQRQSLKLLSELLLDRQNYKTMMRYIGDKSNLILIMNLMREKSPAMRLEAFHVFKIFVANPNKTEAVTQILAKNKRKLVTYLANFTTEREDSTFNSERQLLITTLEGLQENLPAQDAESVRNDKPIEVTGESSKAE